MTYDEAVRYLLALGGELAAPRQPASALSAPGAGPRVAKFDLCNITVLAERLGSPHRAYPCAHIAGTNGKGSTAAMLASILHEAGYHTGLYTSPHLERINERIRINGEEISDADFAATFTRIHHLIEELLATGDLAAHPTFFECLTAMAFAFFAQQEVDCAVFEVGLGGRLDSTNIVLPAVCIITEIDFDHETFLGHSIERIAGEKAGIIKAGVPVVCSATRPEARVVIERRAAELGVFFMNIDDVPGGQETALQLHIPLPGHFQVRNAQTAVLASRVLASRGFGRITDEAIRRGIRATRWPGRLERMIAPAIEGAASSAPTVYFDGTHNPAGARELVAFWDEHFAGRRIHLVFGAVRDKAVDEIAGLLFPRATCVYLTAPRTGRAISSQALAQMTAHHATLYEVIPEPEAALQRALEAAGPEDVVFAAGSLYLVGDLRRWWRQRSVRPATAQTSS